MIAPWSLRPVEEASLFNPAFGALLLARAAADYYKQAGQGLPYPLIFLVMPAVLHSETRHALPATTRAVMHNWTSDHTSLLAAFPNRARRMAPVTKEAVLFGLFHEKLAISDGRLSPGRRPYRGNALPADTTDEVEHCARAAALLGRWFTSAGSTATILSSWGVRP
ncbi:MAG: three component ABC system middle component [Geminicoccaceae bacterium]